MRITWEALKGLLLRSVRFRLRSGLLRLGLRDSDYSIEPKPTYDDIVNNNASGIGANGIEASNDKIMMVSNTISAYRSNGHSPLRFHETHRTGAIAKRERVATLTLRLAID
jgi:hypothetical protein